MASARLVLLSMIILKLLTALSRSALGCARQVLLGDDWQRSQARPVLAPTLAGTLASAHCAGGTRGLHLQMKAKVGDGKKVDRLSVEHQKRTEIRAHLQFLEI